MGLACSFLSMKSFRACIEVTHVEGLQYKEHEVMTESRPPKSHIQLSCLRMR